MEPTAVSPIPAPVPTPEPAPAAPQPAVAPVPPVPVSVPVPEATPTPQPIALSPAPEPAPVSVPAPQPPVQPVLTPAPAPVAATVTQKPKRILLVEDDDALANVYLMRLEAEGFDVYRVSNGEDALVSALQYHPDIVLLDVMMPRVSGFEVLDIIRNTPETASLKVIMLTALSQEADKERAKKLGVDDYLVKSQVVIADVVARIKYHLGMA